MNPLTKACVAVRGIRLASSKGRRILRSVPDVLLVVVGSAITACHAAPSQPDSAVAASLVPSRSITVDVDAAAKRLAGAVRIQTVSFDRQPASAESFRQFREYLAGQFPNVHRVLSREVVNGSSLLFTWAGRNLHAAPNLLMAHQDVVPIAPGTESQWTHPPFSGAITDGFIWGRGSWDDKGNLMAMLEAAESLVTQGYQPEHTIYLAFGHDEETGATAGEQGAREIARLLTTRGVHLSSVLDEGLLITHDAMKGLGAPVALIGIAEKGYLTLTLTTQAEPGHSSMPSKHSAIGTLSEAVVKVRNDGFAPKLTTTVREMLETLAPNFSGLNHLALSNLWLFEPFVTRQLAQTPAADAMLHTTAALVSFNAGNKDSTLPGLAQANINFRVLPGDTVEDVIEHTRHAIADSSVALTPVEPSWTGSVVSTTDSLAYRQIRHAIESIFPETLVAPGLMVGFSDSRHFIPIADNVYRFTPVHASPTDTARFHGTNERVSCENYADMIRFYARLLSDEDETHGH